MTRQGRCYELSLCRQLREPEWTLVHGIVSNGSRRIRHAWLEAADMVYDPVLNKLCAAVVYRHAWQAVPVRRYTALEAAQQAIKHGHCGPWPATATARKPSKRNLGPGLASRTCGSGTAPDRVSG